VAAKAGRTLDAALEAVRDECATLREELGLAASQSE
jgi:hypothetical protein